MSAHTSCTDQMANRSNKRIPKCQIKSRSRADKICRSAFKTAKFWALLNALKGSSLSSEELLEIAPSDTGHLIRSSYWALLIGLFSLGTSHLGTLLSKLQELFKCFKGFLQHGKRSRLFGRSAKRDLMNIFKLNKFVSCNAANWLHVIHTYLSSYRDAEIMLHHRSIAHTAPRSSDERSSTSHPTSHPTSTGCAWQREFGMLELRAKSFWESATSEEGWSESLQLKRPSRREGAIFQEGEHYPRCFSQSTAMMMKVHLVHKETLHLVEVVKCLIGSSDLCMFDVSLMWATWCWAAYYEALAVTPSIDLNLRSSVQIICVRKSIWQLHQSELMSVVIWIRLSSKSKW